jgi:hypothetical protein
MALNAISVSFEQQQISLIYSGSRMNSFLQKTVAAVINPH